MGDLWCAGVRVELISRDAEGMPASYRSELCRELTGRLEKFVEELRVNFDKRDFRVVITRWH